jgi:uncharacterized protein YbaR (Trm112 family)
MSDAPAFVDPETHSTLRLTTEAELEELRRRLEAGELRRRDGGELPTQVDGAYLPASLLYAYPVVDGVPDFLTNERLELTTRLDAKGAA